MLAEYWETLYRHPAAGSRVRRWTIRPGLRLYAGEFSADRLSGLSPLPAGAGEAVFCLQGALEIRTAAGRQTAEPGDLVFLGESGGETAVSFPGGFFRGLTVYARQAEELTGRLGWAQLKRRLTQGGGCLVSHDSGWGAGFLARLSCLPENRWGLYFLLTLRERVFTLAHRQEDRPAGPGQYDSYQRETVRQAHAYMLSHLDEPLTIRALAVRFQVSPTFLKKCFRQLYGQPVHAYLQQHRLRQAARLLRDTRENVAAVAADVGYASASRFGVAFKEQYHMTPGQYRRLLIRMSETEQNLSETE